MITGWVRLDARNDKLHHLAFKLPIIFKISCKIHAGKSGGNLITFAVVRMNKFGEHGSAKIENFDKKKISTSKKYWTMFASVQYEYDREVQEL